MSYCAGESAIHLKQISACSRTVPSATRRRSSLRDGSVVEEQQPHMRGGAQEPLSRADIEEKFLLNARHGGWSSDRAAAALKSIAGLFDGAVELSALRG